MLITVVSYRLAAASLALAVLAVSPVLAQQERGVPDARPFGDKKAEPRAADPKAGDPKAGNPKSVDPNPTGPRQRGAGAVDPKAGDPTAGDPKADGKRAEAAKEPKPIPRSMRRPGATAVPEGGAGRAALLAELYAYLATATDEEVAKRTASAVEHVWHAASSDTVRLLLDRASKAAQDKQMPVALKLFDRAVQLAPDNPEVFARRASVFYAETDLTNAMGDLRRVLALDPNHYKALDGLAQILKDTERKKAALEVFRRLYQVHPFYPGAKSALDELQREVEGQPS